MQTEAMRRAWPACARSQPASRGSGWPSLPPGTTSVSTPASEPGRPPAGTRVSPLDVVTGAPSAAAVRTA